MPRPWTGLLSQSLKPQKLLPLKITHHTISMYDVSFEQSITGSYLCTYSSFRIVGLLVCIQHYCSVPQMPMHRLLDKRPHARRSRALHVGRIMSYVYAPMGALQYIYNVVEPLNPNFWLQHSKFVNVI